MNSHKVCQVCGKPLGPREMYFKKEYEGNMYYACCPLCFSILQMEPKKHIDAYVENKSSKK